MKSYVPWLNFTVVVFLIIVGRLCTLHMTEGEALIAAWPCWSGAFLLAMFGALILWRRR